MDKKYLQKVMVYVLVTVLAVGVMIYVGYHMVTTFTSGLDTQIAYIDTFSETTTFDAYMLRHERVLSTDAEGVVNYLVADGEKVGIGTHLLDICRRGGADIRERINVIDKRIKTLEKLESSAAYSSVSDATNIETKIRETIFSVRTLTVTNDISSALLASDELLYEINRRQLVTGEIKSFAGEIAELKAERASLVAQMTDVAKTIRSDESAYFFYDVDGYEDAFAFDDIDDLTLDSVYAMTESSVSHKIGAVGKLVDDYKWYIAVPTDRAMTLFFNEGDVYDISFDAEGVTIEMKLHSILAVEGGDSDSRACLLFECSDMPEDFEYTRMQPVTIAVRTYSGFRVPLSAVRVVKYGDYEVYGVYILYGNTVYFRRIEMILSQDGYVLCDSHAGQIEEDDGYYDFPMVDTGTAETEPPPEYESIPYLAIYDQVITSSKGLYDGKIVSK